MNALKFESQERLLGPPKACHKRADDTGLWNAFKAWYWYPFHITSCVGFMVFMLYAIDGQDFKTGTPPNAILWAPGRGFYQSEVNGILSTVLVLLRLLAGCGAALLIWRLIYILLEKSDLSLVELCRLADLRLPIKPRLDSPHHFYWSCIAVLITLLLWPPSIAAPLANSSLEWTPAIRVANRQAQLFNVSTWVSDRDSWQRLQYDNDIIRAITSASLMISQDPDYAFKALQDSRIPLRRYIYGSSQYIQESGVGTLSLPYFEVKRINWIDAPANLRYHMGNLNNGSMLTNGGIIPGLLATPGMLGFFMDKQWKYNTTVPQYSTWISRIEKDVTVLPEIKRNISIYVGHRDFDVPSPDGSLPTKNTPCSEQSNYFTRLPQVKQEYTDLFVGEQWRAKRCYMLAEVTMRAGIHPNQRINLTLPGSSMSMNIIDSMEDSTLNSTIQPDKRMLPVLDMMSDVIGLMTTMDLTSRWRKDIDLYVKGTLTSAYIATWSAFPGRTENTTLFLTPSEQVIRARVSRVRLYIWLGMNSTLSLAAVITALCGLTAKTKTIRDTTLAAMTMDIQGVAHMNDNGLCNAAALTKVDHRLKRLKWKDDTDAELLQVGEGDPKVICCKELVLSSGSEAR